MPHLPRTAHLLALAAVLLLTGAAVAAAHTGHRAEPARPFAGSAPPPFPGPGGRPRRGGLRAECAFTTSGMFDPIVFPGQAMAGHTHMFFGSTSVSGLSTNADLVAANADGRGTSCDRAADGSAYWVPDLLADGRSVTPRGVTAHYRPARGLRRATFPVGFQAVAGDKAATTAQAGIGFRCGRTRDPLSAAPPVCPDEIEGVVAFQDCWDGVNVTAPGQTHLATSVNGVCPTTHPVAIPQLELVVHYPADGAAHSWGLSSGPITGYHADFMHGWRQSAIERLAGRSR